MCHRLKSSIHVCFLLVVCFLFGPLGAAAQPQAPTDEFYSWTAPDAGQQLTEDATVVPPGQGALFVPYLTDPQDEPEALVYSGDEQVGGGPNGRRILLPPGAYVVRVGSGPLQQMVQVGVEVRAGVTTQVPVTWSGLKVEVVDQNNVPHRGSFELIRVSDRQPLTVGFGANTLVGERLRTLLLPPGLYRIVRPGANYRTRTDFSTVLLPAGGLVHYKLVLDPSSGELQGSGVVSAEELGEVTEGSAWSRRSSVGLGVPIASTSNVVGATNQTSIGVDVVFDAYLTYLEDQNSANIIFELEEGFIRIDPEGTGALPIQKTRDRLRLDGLYTRLSNPRIGPYVRFGLLTSVFESKVLVTEDRTLVRRFSDGTETFEQIQANQDFKTGDAFSPALFREGVGVNVRVLQQRESFVDWRGGFGFRQNRFSGSFVQRQGAELLELITGEPPDPIETEPGTFVFSEVDSFSQEGLEMTLVATAAISRLLINSNFDLFGDFEDFGQPTVDWRNTFSWRLTGSLSADYSLDVLRLPQVTTQTQVTQSLLFRYSWGS